MALYSIKQKLHQVLFHLLFNISTIILEVGKIEILFVTILQRLVCNSNEFDVIANVSMAGSY